MAFANDATLFWTVFLIVFFINIFAPFVSEGLSDTITTHPASDADPVSPPSLFSISLFNVFLVPFWTLSMPFYMNLIIMIPLRVLAWYLILRMIRGN